MGAFDGPVRFTITDLTALQTSRIRLRLPFVPSKIEVENPDAGYSIKLQVNGEAGGIGYKQSDDSQTALTTTTGLEVDSTGFYATYNNPATPTYKDQDGTAITAGSIFDPEDVDVLDTFLPQETDTGLDAPYPLIGIGINVALPTAANNADLRGDGETISVLAWR